ncbi:MAG: Serine-type D-Ala-D-Ala carboxypeptidase [Candidatus Daviesbacteria bacterium GW2011_GWA1_41_61]|uniref:Serine-type D-Ala-D-Ala carboxypeptidase n=1 Tax=Candidatus Daviesbacteria bacterium GW2011_GWA2_40_9 TaxID=1618424 RepID=A0A0G0U3P9_9BACT|nr:MAG: Serine-type D-Ala-D-Ala carboxypeptidase [Candidatus Daviesbacteria bacterium GW2011_GWC1_40_9]KKR81791.1 MAG: Serine-type D-Ala-D-Ala carboxypeptidase [Candidatus Daviesbacteria bacterium GW2011_GWA2_40_9]KKR92359.1 MAG: Serine-type D-Ala-D-Ala carboxypeptidase [Candidatus Daviesbacteria bacterium GW2011_GWB1_41_15]KKS14547.1 MAG: Serine-type D-Ala-D-Ala carboxypeptidase [Candidatus Daviesbacteria bacterium GW2011_GWA1_41_61]
MKIINFKVFLISLIAQFTVSFLLQIGLKAPSTLDFLRLPRLVQEGSLTNPLPAKDDLWQVIKTKIEQKKPQPFQLKKESSLIPTIYASGDYDQVASYLVVNLDSGVVLAEKNMSQKLPIASLTKVMTAVAALDLASPDELFSVSYNASLIEPTKIGVVPGQKMKLEELLQALLLTSANDAAEVIKEGIDQKYQEPIFIQAMNQKAKFLGLLNSSFANPQGFDNPQNFSSAEDLTILTYYALRNYPEIAQITPQGYQLLPADNNHKRFDLYNWNGLIGVYPGARGVKIGNTEMAGKTTVVTAEREGKRILAVVLGAPGVMERDLWAAQLLDSGFAKLGISPAQITPSQLQVKYLTWRYW